MSKSESVSNYSGSDSNDWNGVMRPKRNLLDINLKEIWNYRDLITLFVRRDFVAQHKHKQFLVRFGISLTRF